MNLFWLSCILTALSNFGIAIIVLAKGWKNPINRIFFGIAISIGIWGLGGSVFSILPEQKYQQALFWWQFSYSGVIFVPIYYTHFILRFFNLQKRVFIRVIYLLGFVSLFFNWFDGSRFFLCDLRFVFNQFYWQDWVKSQSIIYLIYYLSAWVFLLSYSFFILIKNYLKSTGLLRNQLKFFIFGSIIGWFGAEAMYLPDFRIDVYPYLNFFVGVYPAIIAYAIIKYRLMDIRVFISRAVAFFVSYPFLLAIPFILAYRLYPYLEPRLGRHWWLVPSGMLVIIATLAPAAYAQLSRKMEGKLLAEQKRYQKLLLQAASGMVTEHDLGKLSKLIVYIVKRSVKIKFASIFLDDKKEGVYRLKALRDSGQVDYKNVTFLYEHPFVKYVKKNKEPFFYEEMPKYIRNSLTAFSDVNLVVPAAIEDNLLGFVFLGEKDNRQPFTEDDINVFKILSSQAALAVENCIFLQEFKQAQERIFTAEKLASIGGMADGVAHQIKNRLNQFSVASGELKYEIKDFLEKYPKLIEKDPDIKKALDYMTEIADSLISNVKKTDGIIKGILNFARVEEKETFFSRFSLKEVVDLAVDLLKVKHEIAEVPLKVDLDSSDLIYGVKSQITESIYNILDNSYEAMQEKKIALSKEEIKDYLPLMELRLTEQPTTHLIEIIDNGAGIHKRDEHKIFAPFFTTKSSYKSGTGIGMYVVKRMIEENHKGKVWFETEYGEGAHFYIQLPRR